MKTTPESLLARMTLAEKAGQMTQLTIDTVAYGEVYHPEDPLRLHPDKLRAVLVDKHVGSLLNVGTHAHSTDRWRELLAQLQEVATATRLGIPLLYGIDSIHGANYVMDSVLFPQEIALAATGNPALVEELFALAARDTLRAGIPWLFSPSVDVGRDPRWARIWEGFGEDPHHGSVLGAAAVRGIESVPGAASCLKHFLAYGAPQTGKDRSPAWVPERYLREYYLPPFVAGMRAGAPSIMVNSAEINGIPVHGDRRILIDLLREELGFEGVVVTDWEDILFLHTRHRTADSYREAVRQAIEAGIDMSMTPLETEFTDHLIDLVETGELSMERIDASVLRILKLKERCGLFDHPIPGLSLPAAERSADLALATRAAEQSVVLCRNTDDLLPLDPDSNLLIVGPTAHSKRALHGGWTYTWQGDHTEVLDPTRYPTLLEGLREEWTGEVAYVQGCDFLGYQDLDGLSAAAATADTIILCLGEASYTEFYGSLDDLNLPDAQQAVARAVLALGKPVVLVLLEGRPRCIHRFAADIPAVLTAFYPGHGGPAAIAGILSGRVNPSGRLPVTYPKHPNNLTPYDHKFTENQEYQGVPMVYDPEFPFGHGLSYTTFTYDRFLLSDVRMQAGDTLEVSVRITNSGSRSGAHVVQLYSRDHYASITPSVRRLRAFERIELAAGAQTTVRFLLTARDLAFVGRDNHLRAEAGRFTLSAGDRSAEFDLLETVVL